MSARSVQTRYEILRPSLRIYYIKMATSEEGGGGLRIICWETSRFRTLRVILDQKTRTFFFWGGWKGVCISLSRTGPTYLLARIKAGVEKYCLKCIFSNFSNFNFFVLRRRIQKCKKFVNFYFVKHIEKKFNIIFVIFRRF